MLTRDILDGLDGVGSSDLDMVINAGWLYPGPRTENEQAALEQVHVKYIQSRGSSKERCLEACNDEYGSDIEDLNHFKSDKFRPCDLTLRQHAGMAIAQGVMKALTMPYTIPDENGTGPRTIQVHPLTAVMGRCNNVGKVAAVVADTIMEGETI